MAEDGDIMRITITLNNGLVSKAFGERHLSRPLKNSFDFSDQPGIAKL